MFDGNIFKTKSSYINKDDNLFINNKNLKKNLEPIKNTDGYYTF
jgi:hypothetical protein